MKPRKPIKRKAPLKRSQKPLKRTRLKPVSKKRAKDMKTYSAKRTAYLAAHPYCQATIRLLHKDEAEVIANNGWYANLWARMVRCPKSCDIHHVQKRGGSNYLDESTWLAVCREIHEKIHADSNWARSEGLLA